MSKILERLRYRDQERYLFTKRVKKYPKGKMCNRATKQGYWKINSGSKEIKSNGVLVGMKNTCVYYQGKGPEAKKTNWLMHEFLGLQDGEFQEWVVCRIFKKGSSKSEVTEADDEMVSDPMELSSSDDDVSSNDSTSTRSTIGDMTNNGCVAPQQQMPAVANTTTITPSSFGFQQPQSQQYAMLRPFVPGYPASSAIPQFMQNQLPPAGIHTVPALPPDFQSNGNFNPLESGRSTF